VSPGLRHVIRGWSGQEGRESDRQARVGRGRCAVPYRCSFGLGDITPRAASPNWKTHPSLYCTTAAADNRSTSTHTHSSVVRTRARDPRPADTDTAPAHTILATETEIAETDPETAPETTPETARARGTDTTATATRTAIHTGTTETGDTDVPALSRCTVEDVLECPARSGRSLSEDR